MFHNRMRVSQDFFFFSFHCILERNLDLLLESTVIWRVALPRLHRISEQVYLNKLRLYKVVTTEYSRL